MNAIRGLCFAALLVVQASTVWAVDPASLPQFKQTRLGLYVTAEEAAGKMAKAGKDILFLDIRTPAETAFVGMAGLVDANVPYMVMPDFPAWDEARHTLKIDLNPDFLPEVEKRLGAKGLNRTSDVI